MRILQVAHVLPPEANTGVENYTAQLSTAMSKAGHTVAVFARSLATDVPPMTMTREENQGVLTVRVALGGGHHFPHQRVRWGMSAAFRKFVQEWNPEVVHFQHLLYHSLDYPAIAQEAGASVVITLHDFWYTCPTVQRLDFRGELCNRLPGRSCLPCLWSEPRTRLISREALSQWSKLPVVNNFLNLAPTTDELEDWATNSNACLNAANLIISPSQFVADDLARANIRPKRLVVSDYGIPRPDESNLPQVEKDGILHFGMIGSHRLKGTQVAVDAFQKLVGLPVRLHIFGTDEFPNIPSNVVISGRYAASDIDRVFSTFEVLLVPSIWYENAPFVIREAFARRRPVIASRIGGMAESVRDGVDGLHFPVGDADALSTCIRRLLEEPELLSRLQQGIQSPKYYQEHVQELLDLYGATGDHQG